MIGPALIVLGYISAVAALGWAGLAVIAAHIAILLALTCAARRKP